MSAAETRRSKTQYDTGLLLLALVCHYSGADYMYPTPGTYLPTYLQVVSSGLDVDLGLKHRQQLSHISHLHNGGAIGQQAPGVRRREETQKEILQIAAPWFLSRQVEGRP